MRQIICIGLLACLSGGAAAEPQPAPLRLALVKIMSDPFKLKFDGKSDIPTWTNRNGFVAFKFTPKYKMIELPSGRFTKVDVSELTLKRGDKTIVLITGRSVMYEEHIVHLSDLSDQKKYSVGTGQEISVGTRRLRLREVNVKKLNCTLVDIESGEEFIIKRMAQQSPAGDLPTAAAEAKAVKKAAPEE